MKTKIYALLMSAALAAPVLGGSHPGGGGSRGGGGFSAGSARGGGVSSFHSMPMRSFGGNRMMYSGQRFSSFGARSPSSMAFRQRSINSNGNASIGTRQFTPGNFNRGNRLAGISNTGNHGINNNFKHDGPGTGHVRNGNNLPSNWQNHVVAQHSANWNRNWDRGRDHSWHGHHCRFINGSWVIFDLGFYPWGWGYPYDYPYDYYGYPYSYDPGYYDSGVYQGQEYYGDNNYGSSDQYTDSTVTAAQERLAREGYYNGAIDGVLGTETRRAIARYQSNHGLRATGALTTDTLAALGLRQVAGY
jgi:hypothetical protein